MKDSMKKMVGIACMATLVSTNGFAMQKVHDEVSLRDAIDAANNDPAITKIVFAGDAAISLTGPVIYNGSQPLSLVGNNCIIDASQIGGFDLNDDLTPVFAKDDGALVFNTSSDITIRRLTVQNSSLRGIVVNIPENAQGNDIAVVLNKVNIFDSALYGLHVDDNADDFDDGQAGSEIGIELEMYHSRFTGNGTGAIDMDGVRVDERGEGDINATVMHTSIDGNGGDGMELDEAGPGLVGADVLYASFNDNGFYNEEDLDDGFDIDEADEGDLLLNLFKVQVAGNMDEGLDFDETGEGDVMMTAHRISAVDNNDEAIKVDEEDAGNLRVRLYKVDESGSGDDGIQFTELGEGRIRAYLSRVAARDNKKYGIKIEQWFEEDEEQPVEPAGLVKARKVVLEGNDKSDEIKTNNVVVR